MTQGPVETEVKIAISDVGAIERKLEEAGFTVSAPRVFEANTIYDTPDASLRSRGCVLRIRTAGETAKLTFKGRGEAGTYKVRPETEFEVSDGASAASVLAELGYRPTFRYEKFRTEYSGGTGGGLVMVDETPIGAYLELEGQPEWIDAVAARLGFTEDSYITMSYGSLYLAYCGRENLTPSHMVFPSESGKRSTSEKSA